MSSQQKTKSKADEPRLARAITPAQVADAQQAQRSLPVRLSLEVSSNVNDMIESMATITGSSKSDVLRRAIALMHYAVEAAENGKVIGIADRQGGKLETVIVGPGF